MKVVVTDIDLYYDWFGRLQDKQLEPIPAGISVEVEGRLNGGLTISGRVELLPDEHAALKAVLDQIAARVGDNADELLTHRSGPVWMMR